MDKDAGQRGYTYKKLVMFVVSSHAPDSVVEARKMRRVAANTSRCRVISAAAAPAAL